MITASTYIMFVAPLFMGIGGLMIYAITIWLTREAAGPPAE